MLLSLPCPGIASGQKDTVDFRYAPARSFSVIGFPADWLKSTVTESGALAYDFGPGPYARPLTEISLSVKSESLVVRNQFLRDAGISVVETELGSPSVTIHQQVFAIVPERFTSPSVSSLQGRVRRLGGLTGCASWAPVAPTVDRLFRNVAWGTNRPIRYRVTVPRGDRKVVALGICESYKTQEGKRVLDLQVEGSPPQRVDPVRGGRNGVPIAQLFNARDENRDGELSIEVHAAPGSDPNVILNGFWVFPEGTKVSSEDVITGRATPRAEIAYSCGLELEHSAPGPRLDAMRADFSGSAGVPFVTVRSRRDLHFDPKSGVLLADGKPLVVSRPAPIRASTTGDGLQLELPEGTRHADLLVMHGLAKPPDSFPSFEHELEKTRRYWSTETSIPKGIIRVPDPGIQYILDASVRNIYQVAEVVDGLLQFQPGPSVYRGLWVGDMTLIAPQALMLGDTLHVREYIENTLRYRQPDGQIRVGEPAVFIAETPMVMTAMWWYSRSSGDLRWLEKNWGAMKEGAEWIRTMRNRTLAHQDAPNRGMMPPGFLDGGLTEAGADYGSLWWAMIGLEKAIDAARWIGKDSLASAWHVTLEALHESFRSGARRDLRPDTSGIPYLPIIVADTSREFPQRGQYAFLLPLRFGDFFDRQDPLLDSVIVGTLAMLDARTKEGMIVSSGWLTDGVWSWLAGVHSIAHQWFGSPAQAIRILYAFANHATRLGTFVEEQLTQDKGTKTTGDASDAESSAQFLDAVRNLIARERGGNLEVLTGVPDSWIRPGAAMEICQGGSLFGPITLSLRVSSDGKRATLSIDPVDGRQSQGRIIVSIEFLKRLGFTTVDGKELPSTLELGWKQGLNLGMVRHL
jgi:hypothetical protein